MARTETETGEKKARKPMVPRPIVVLLKPKVGAGEGDCPVEVVLATRDAGKALEVMQEGTSTGEKVWFVAARL